MEKLLNILREKKITMLIYMLLFICLIYLFSIKIIFGSRFNVFVLVIIWVTTAITYLIVWLTLDYLSLRKKIKWVNVIYNEFAHMQIFLDNNDIMLEILEGEYEKLLDLADKKKLEVERISNKNDLVKVLIK